MEAYKSIFKEKGITPLTEMAVPEGMSIIIDAFYVTMEEDSYEHGALPDTAWEAVREKNIGTAKDFKEMVKLCAKHYPAILDVKMDGFGVMDDDGRILVQHEVTKYGDTPSTSEMKQFKNGEINLCIADMDIYIRIGKVYTPTSDEIKQMFNIQQL